MLHEILNRVRKDLRLQNSLNKTKGPIHLLHVMINHVQSQPGGHTVDATQMLREMSHLSSTISLADHQSLILTAYTFQWTHRLIT